jgi:HD superfamily phosphohydrolase
MKAAFEIRDPIHGPIGLSRNELQIIDSPYVQRLRGIKQTGFAELAFPGATHNRYSHSLGAFHLAGKAFDLIFENFEWADEAERSRFRSYLRMAALLHDLGHGPLSHAIEQAMPSKKEVLGFGSEQASHEDYTEAIILRSSLSKLLEETFGKEMPLALVSIIRNENRHPGLFLAGRHHQKSLFPLVSSLISGEIDVDRMDYMIRDSLFCGIPYGHFDRDWIFSNLGFIEENNQLFLALDSRALYAFEDFLLSRYHLYLMVYLHHKSVIYDEMLFQFLNADLDGPRLPSSVDDYLQVDDHWLMSRLRKSKNPWAQRIVQQKPYRMLLEIHSDQTEEAKTYADELEAKLGHAKISYFRSSSSGLLSKYHNARDLHRNTIYVIYRDTRFTSSTRPGISKEPIEQATELFERYKNKRIIDRLFAETTL